MFVPEEHKMLTWLIDTDGDWVLTTVRVVLGVVLFAHGAQKLLGWFGGLGLIVGLLTRVAALGIIITMAVAILMVHSKVGFFMNWSGNQRGEGFEYHLVVIALAVVVMVKGAGAFSFDSALSHHDVTIAKSIKSAFGIGSEK
jgi:putative oxidoreductase